MHSLRNYLLAAVAVFGMSLFVANTRAGEDHAMTGVLIDNACGAKATDEAAATKHPMKCSLKDACAASGYQLVVGDKHYKLDDKGNEVEMVSYKGNEDSVEYKWNYTYLEFDSQGNWIKRLESFGDKDGNFKTKPVKITYRTITYY